MAKYFKPCGTCERPYGWENPLKCKDCAKRLKNRARNARYYEKTGKPRREKNVKTATQERDSLGRLKTKRTKRKPAIPLELAKIQEEFIKAHRRAVKEHNAAVAEAKIEAARRAEERATNPRYIPLSTPMDLGDGTPGGAGGVVSDVALARFLGKRRKRIARLEGGSGAGRRNGVSDDVIRVNYRVRLAMAGR